MRARKGMSAQDFSQSKARTKVLSNVSDLDRLLRIMARWWRGWNSARIAREQGLSRQRVGRLLTRVGCTRGLWQRADHRRTGTTRRVLASHVVVAREALLHRCAGRLTVKQRAALAWRAMGLGSVETARRMATTPTSVRNLIVAARWRLERLSRPKRKRAGMRVQRAASGMSPPAGDEGIAIDWDRLLDGTDDRRSRVNSQLVRASAERGGTGQARQVGAVRAPGDRGRRSGAAGTAARPRRRRPRGRTGRDNGMRRS